MLCPLRTKGQPTSWIERHSEDFECVGNCAWLMMDERNGRRWGVCAVVFMAANVRADVSSMVNINELPVTPGEQSPGNDKTTS